jgi:hypothetical protein
MQERIAGLSSQDALWIRVSALPSRRPVQRETSGLLALLLHGEEDPDGSTY